MIRVGEAGSALMQNALGAFALVAIGKRTTTVGLFELNVKLDFNHGSQRAEVDLFCAS